MKKTTEWWAASSRASLAEIMKFHSTQHLQGHNWNTVFRFGFPKQKKEVDRPERVKRTDTGMMKQLGSLSCKKGLRELRLLSLEK